MQGEADLEHLVEPFARALAIADGKDPDAPAWARFPGGYPEGICWRDQYVTKARAILTSPALLNELKAARLRGLEEAAGIVEQAISGVGDYKTAALVVTIRRHMEKVNG